MDKNAFLGSSKFFIRMMVQKANMFNLKCLASTIKTLKGLLQTAIFVSSSYTEQLPSSQSGYAFLRLMRFVLQLLRLDPFKWEK